MRLLFLFILAASLLLAQGQRHVFSKIMTGEPYTLECYLPQITNGPNFPSWSSDGNWIAYTADLNETIRPAGQLEVRVVDSATGKPLRARVHLNAADGRAYAPTESWFRADWMMFDHMDQGEYRYFHTDGEFNIDLVPGTSAARCLARIRVFGHGAGRGEAIHVVNNFDLQQRAAYSRRQSLHRKPDPVSTRNGILSTHRNTISHSGVTQPF